MTVYLDENYCCRTDYAPGLRPMECSFFDGKCREFIEGYRFVPEGETWQRSDGQSFTGPMLAPVQNSQLLLAAQRGHESLLPQLTELREKLQRLWDCLDGLATLPGLEQLQDFLLSIREIMEDE